MSRRVRSAAILTTVALGVAAGGCGTPPPTRPDSSRYLEAAIRVAGWLQAQSTDGFGAEVPDRLHDVATSPNLGVGATGRAVFFAELYRATGDTSYRRAALASATVALDGIPAAPSDYGLYTGVAGVAAALGTVGVVVDDRRLRSESRRLFGMIVARAAGADGIGSLGDVYDVMGGWAGIGLALLDGYGAFGDPAFLATAVKAGDALLAVGLRTEGGGTRWMRGERLVFDLPNFSHGTAGVGYFLARLAEASGEPRFRDGALAAARYLDEIAAQEGGVFLVPYGVPNDGYESPYDIGWAHGPAGTARLHYVLWRLSGDSAMEARVEAAARSLAAAGLPHESADTTRWKGTSRFDRRFGTAGAAAFLIDWGRLTANAGHLELASRIVDEILRQGTEGPEGLFWELPLYEFQGGGDRGVFTGYFYGSAGLGLVLLQQHYAGSGRYPAVRLPDDPFPRGP